uniref:Uncharacterized protein n=1 Tax=Arundo donax TaxID=35708 RepID=A0A0A8Y6L8_ARUDO
MTEIYVLFCMPYMLQVSLLY